MCVCMCVYYAMLWCQKDLDDGIFDDVCGKVPLGTHTCLHADTFTHKYERMRM